MMRKVYQIEGLDCANCAREVEEYLNKNEAIEKAVIDFMGKKIFITFKNEELSMEAISTLIADVEDGVTLLDPSNKKEEKDGEEESEKGFMKGNEIKIIRLVVSSVLLAFAYFWYQLPFVAQIIIYVVSYLSAGYDVVLSMFKGFTKKRFFTEYSLMTVATIGALCIQEFPEAVLVMILYQIGELLQDAAVDHSRNQIKNALEIRPKEAMVYRDNTWVTVAPEDLKIGEKVEVKVGEIIPADGKILEGNGTVDMAHITGESVPVTVQQEENLYSGSILVSGHIFMEVQKSYADSTVSKILELLESSSEKKGKAEKFVSKFASIYTPIVFLVALLVAVIFPIFGTPFSKSIYNALIFLVVSCPCAIVISVPLTSFVGMGELAHRGIIVKGSNYLDLLRSAKTIVCDKTGTLTKGKLAVEKIVSPSLDEKELLEYVAYAESISNHPIAKAIVEAYGKEVDNQQISDAQEILGKGVHIAYKNHIVEVGNPKLVKVDEIAKEPGSIVYVSVDGEYKGYIVLKDQLKDNAIEFVKEAHTMNMKVEMLSGDKKEYAELVANQLGLDDFKGELLPEEKVSSLEKVLEAKENQPVLYMGDGVNDAPSIMRADVGVAMGAVGSEAAIEAADMVIMNDDLKSVITSCKIAKKVYRTSIFNIAFALTIKFVVYVLALFNISSMWMALLADVGVTLLLIFHSLFLSNRLKKIK